MSRRSSPVVSVVLLLAMAGVMVSSVFSLAQNGIQPRPAVAFVIAAAVVAVTIVQLLSARKD